MSGERRARLGLACCAEPGSAALARLVAEHGAEAVWAAVRDGRHHQSWGRRAALTDLDDVERRTEAIGARFVVPGDPDWPTEVDDLDHAPEWEGHGGRPLGLWLRGTLPSGPRGVALVGARACSSYGEDVAAELAHDLAQVGHCVVSGGAFGIDGAAHRGALAAGGPTVAVLSSGVDAPYPAAHASLFDRICECGCLVSEYLPGSHPTRSRFLVRNRLVAALSAGTVVVEAAARSGARNTAGWAMRLGRVLMAVPGPVTSSGSLTPHRLIRDGEALLVGSAVEVRAAINPVGQDTLVEAEGPRRALDGLESRERQVFEAVPGRGSVAVDALVAELGMRPAEVLAALARLEELRLVEARADGGWGLGRARPDATTRAARPAANRSTARG